MTGLASDEEIRSYMVSGSSLDGIGGLIYEAKGRGVRLGEGRDWNYCYLGSDGNAQIALSWEPMLVSWSECA